MPSSELTRFYLSLCMSEMSDNWKRKMLEFNSADFLFRCIVCHFMLTMPIQYIVVFASKKCTQRLQSIRASFGDFVRELNLLDGNFCENLQSDGGGDVVYALVVWHRYNFSCRFIRFSFRSICSAVHSQFLKHTEAFGISNVKWLVAFFSCVCRWLAVYLCYSVLWAPVFMFILIKTIKSDSRHFSNIWLSASTNRHANSISRIHSVTYSLALDLSLFN